MDNKHFIITDPKLHFKDVKTAQDLMKIIDEQENQISQMENILWTRRASCEMEKTLYSKMEEKISQFSETLNVEELQNLSSSYASYTLGYEKREYFVGKINEKLIDIQYQLSHGRITPMMMKGKKQRKTYILYLMWLIDYADENPTAADELAWKVKIDMIKNSRCANDEYIEGLFKQIALKCKKEQNNEE